MCLAAKLIGYGRVVLSSAHGTPKKPAQGRGVYVLKGTGTPKKRPKNGCTWNHWLHYGRARQAPGCACQVDFPPSQLYPKFLFNIRLDPSRVSINNY